MTAKKVFLSYARIDIQRATALYEELKHNNLQVWFDQVELKPGMRWEPAIRKAIQEADYFIALLSHESCSSKGFRHKELRRAIEIMQELPDDKIYVIPARLNDCEPPVGGLSELHRVDLFPSWENGIGQICSTLGVKAKKKRSKTNTAVKRPLIEGVWDQFSSQQSKKGTSGITSGFRDLDELTSGFQSSELFVIAARPSVGKTAFVCNCALSMAKSSHGVLIISLNETNLKLTERLLCTIARINSYKMRQGNLDDFERFAFMEASNELSQLPVFIDDLSSRTMAQIDKAIRIHVRENNVACVMIDYLQLIEVEERNQPREQQLSSITRSLKQTGKGYEGPNYCTVAAEQ